MCSSDLEFGVGTPVAEADTDGSGIASGPTIVGPDDCDGDPTQEFGIGLAPCALTPKQVPGLTSGVTAVSVGDGNTCAVHNGAIKCFGIAGVIIDPATSGLVTCNEGNLSCALAPVTVPGMGSGVTALSAHNSGHACAIQWPSFGSPVASRAGSARSVRLAISRNKPAFTPLMPA